MNPQFPIYIPSKGRARTRVTVRHLEKMGVPYSVVVEAQEYDEYAAVIDPAKILVLNQAYQRDYDTFWTFPDGTSKGSGPARNFIWDHAASSGQEWHWIMDDNIRGFFRLHQNLKIPVGDGTVLRCMEDFVLRYSNVAMAGPNYFMFAARKNKAPPFVVNTRLYSCILIRNDLPFRWRGRYNEDADLSLRVLKAGWCTIQFNAFLQYKEPTQTMKGGNTDAFYAIEGTLPKSRMLVDMHPDVAKVVWRFGRWHHHVDYRPFKNTKLIRRKDIDIPQGVNNYGMKLVQLARPDGTPYQAAHREAPQAD
jgi:hypothetical protein